MLDATNPEAVAWLHAALDALVDDFGIDGFKFDGGDLWSYRADDLVAGSAGSDRPVRGVGAGSGRKYPFNEYRACWKMGGQPLAQRLHDKPPTWGAGGLASLIPDSIAQGLIGHAFVCPDMVGGGELGAFSEANRRRGTLRPVRTVRRAVPDDAVLRVAGPGARRRAIWPRCVDAVAAASALVPDIIRLAKQAGRTGEPILRPLAFHHPGYEDVTDQFLLGEDILAAPVLERGATSRRVLLPPGRWIATDGAEYHGPQVIDLPVS